MIAEKEHLAAAIAGMMLLFGVLSAVGVSAHSTMTGSPVIPFSFGGLLLEAVVFIILFFTVLGIGMNFVFHESRESSVDSLIRKYH